MIPAELKKLHNAPRKRPIRGVLRYKNQMAEICIANIGPKQRRMRLNFGLVAAAAGVAFVAVTAFTGLPAWTRLAAFVPFFGAALGFFQYKEKT